MRGAYAPIVLIGRADVVNIPLVAAGYGLSDHTCPTVPAEYHAAEQADRFTLGIRAAPGIPLEHALHAVKQQLGNDSFMVVLDYAPFRFCFGDALMHLIAGRCILTLRQCANINGVLQDTNYRCRRPERFGIGFERRCELHTERTLILHRRQHTQPIQRIGDILRADALQLPLENIPHDVRCKFIHDEAVLILFILHVAVGGKGAEILSLLPLDFQL